jgi:aconitase B
MTDAPRFSDQFLDEIRARVRVSTIVGRKVRLEKRGREFIGLSPFTSEKTPSFTVSDEKGFYHCAQAWGVSGRHADLPDEGPICLPLTLGEARAVLRVFKEMDR